MVRNKLLIGLTSVLVQGLLIIFLVSTRFISGFGGILIRVGVLPTGFLKRVWHCKWLIFLFIDVLTGLRDSRSEILCICRLCLPDFIKLMWVMNSLRGILNFLDILLSESRS